MSEWSWGLVAGVRMLLAVVFAILALILVASPAAACVSNRLLPEGTPDDFAAADVVFTGTVVKRDEPLSFGIESSMDSIGWTFVVENVEKGAFTDRIRVESARGSASCGVEFRFGQRYRVFARHAGWFSLTAMQGDVEQLEPLADPPPTEPGGINVLTTATILPLLGILVVVVPVGWALADVARDRRRERAEHAPERR